jgi:hypothetical protein
MKRVVLALFVGISFGLLAACAHSGITLSPSYKGIKIKGGPRAFVTLAMEDGTCKATDGVGVLGGKKAAKVTWFVSNYCDSDQYLRFTHYQERLDPNDPTKLGPVDPDVVDPDPRDSNKIKAGDEDKKVEANIKKDGGGVEKLYKYWICVGPASGPTTNCLDPDIDVWP